MFAILSLIIYMVSVMNDSSIVLIKVGKLYHVFNNDALIISGLFNYKIANHKCVISVNDIDKITGLLEKNNINYIIKMLDGDVVKSFGENNNYAKYLEKVNLKNTLNGKIPLVLKKMSILDQGRLRGLVKIMENEIEE